MDAFAVVFVVGIQKWSYKLFLWMERQHYTEVIGMPSKLVDFKERNVRRALRAADKEGLVVSGYEILPSGLIRVLTAPPGQAAPFKIDRDTNEWDADYGKPAA